MTVKQPLVFILVFVTLFFKASVRAESTAPVRMKFDHAFNLGKQGMRAFLHDRDGFIWIGSLGSGLFRWNGYELKNYKAASGQLSEGTVYRILEDNENPDILWVATNGGLNRFDKSTDTFTCYRHDPARPESISDNGVKEIVQDRTQSNIIWVGTRQGLNRFDKLTGKFTRYFHDPQDPHSLDSNYIWQMAEDPTDPEILWVLPFQKGVEKFNKKTGKVTHYRHDPADPNSLGSYKAAGMVWDRNDPTILWVGTIDKGLERFDTHRQVFTHYPVDRDSPDGYPGGPIIDLYDDGQGRLWLGGLIANNGLTVFEKDGGTFTNYRHTPGQPYSLGEDTVASVNQDRRGRYWITGYGGDVSKIDPFDQNFELFRKTPGIPGGLSDNSITRIVEDRSGTVWVTTASGGLNRFEEKHAAFTSFRHDPEDKLSIDVDNVFDFFEDSKGRFWLSQFLGPLVEFDPSTGTVRRRFATGAESFTVITEDPDEPGLLWLGLRGLGLARFDTATGAFRYFGHNPQEPSSGPANDMPRVIIHDRVDTSIWIGSNLGGGLSRFDKKRLIFTHYKSIPGDPESLGADSVDAIFQDSEGTVWVATAGGGLNRFDRSSGTFVRYGRSIGIPDNIMAILQDDQGKLWLSTDEGLLQFNKDTLEVEARFGLEDGLQGNVFNLDCALRRKNGEMWFGGTNGLNRFFPQQLKINTNPPPVVITALKRGGTPMSLERVPEKTRRITLEWPNNFFEFEFAALNYTRPEKNRYRYILEGIDTEWFNSGTRRFGRYTNLPGGRYTLRIIASNNDGIWNEKGVAIEVVSLPPFWETRWFYLFLSCLLFAIVGIVTFYFHKLRHEIIEREHAEKEREESETRYRSLLESQTELVARFKAGGEFTFVNQVYCDFFHKSNNELIGEKWQLIPMGDEIHAIEEKLQALTPSNQTVITENRVRSGAGKTHWMQFVHRGFFDTSGKLTEIQSVGRDISARKQIEEALFQSETYLRTLIHSIPDLIWLKDEQGVYLFCNSRFERFFGAREEEIIGKTDYDFVEREQADSSRKLDKLAIAEGGPCINEEEVVYADDGHHEILETIKTPIYGENGRLIGVLGIARDITGRKQAEEERKKLESRLRQSHKMEAIGTLAGGIAHDFNNILGIILGNTELAMRRIEDRNPGRLHLEKIQKAGFRASEVVRQLLNFSRKTEQDKKNIDPVTIVRESIKLLRSSLPTSIEIELDVDPELHPITADPTQVHQVLINLCTNAAHAMEKDGGILKIGLTEVVFEELTVTQFQQVHPGRYCQLTVSDTGHGIDPEISANIFDPYFTTKEVGKGTGMGLAVVLGIVKNHNGAIWVSSEPGKGSTFTVLFPIVDTEIHKEQSASTILPTGNETVLFVDDEPELADIGRDLLEFIGYTVETQTDPVEALALYRSDPARFNLIITDMTMPHLTGDQLIQEVLKINPEMPVILTTGFSSKINKEQALRIGARDYIEKPLDIKRLAYCIREVLDAA